MPMTSAKAARRDPAVIAPKDAAASGISLKGVSKVFADGRTALTPTNLRVDEGQFFSIVDPWDCGKSTHLRVIAGLTRATSGRVDVAADAGGGEERGRVHRVPDPGAV